MRRRKGVSQCVSECAKKVKAWGNIILISCSRQCTVVLLILKSVYVCMCVIRERKNWWYLWWCNPEDITYSLKELGGLRTPLSWSPPLPSECSWSWPQSPEAWLWKSLPLSRLMQTPLERARDREMKKDIRRQEVKMKRNTKQKIREWGRGGIQSEHYLSFTFSHLAVR